MDSKFYSLSSSRLPDDLTLDIIHGFDFEVPYSQANYNFLDYSFKHKKIFEIRARVYLDELSMPTELRSDVSASPCFEPYKRDDLPSNYIASILKVLTALGYSAIYEDYEDEPIKLETLYKAEKLEVIMQDWLEQMNELGSSNYAH